MSCTFIGLGISVIAHKGLVFDEIQICQSYVPCNRLEVDTVSVYTVVKCMPDL